VTWNRLYSVRKTFYLTTLSNAEIIHRRWQNMEMSMEYRWNDTDKEAGRYSVKYMPNVILFNTNPTQTRIWGSYFVNINYYSLQKIRSIATSRDRMVYNEGFIIYEKDKMSCLLGWGYVCCFWLMRGWRDICKQERQGVTWHALLSLINAWYIPQKISI